MERTMTFTFTILAAQAVAASICSAKRAMKAAVFTRKSHASDAKVCNTHARKKLNLTPLTNGQGSYIYEQFMNTEGTDVKVYVFQFHIIQP